MSTRTLKISKRIKISVHLGRSFSYLLEIVLVALRIVHDEVRLKKFNH